MSLKRSERCSLPVQMHVATLAHSTKGPEMIRALVAVLLVVFPAAALAESKSTAATYNQCRAGGGTVRSCCSTVGGSISVTDKKVNGRVIIATSCTFTTLAPSTVH